MFNNRLLILGFLFIFIPFVAFAQSDGSIPPADGAVMPPSDGSVQTPGEVKPQEPIIPVQPPSGTSTSTPTPTPTPTPNPDSPVQNDAQNVSDALQVAPLQDNNAPESSSNSGSSVAIWVAIAVAVASAMGWFGLNTKNKGKSQENKCDSIKDLIEQKKKQLEEEIKNYPENKLKGVAKDVIINQLKKNEALGTTIEIAEDVKKKYNKSLKAIELLEKKYDLCMLSLPSTKKEMNKITTHLWFDKEAKEASEFYVSVFGGDSKVKNINTLKDTPSGDADIVSFDLLGTPFMAISAGPYFKFTQAISFLVNFDPSKDKNAEQNIDTVWNKLSEGGKVLMEIQEYPWSKRYGWVQDKYGLGWQLMLTNPDGDQRPEIIPSLLFVGDVYGKAKEAVEFYLSVFKDSKLGNMLHYGANQEPNKEGTVMFSDFQLLGQWFTAMDGGGEHNFKFNEAISFIVNCKDQAEIDYYWEKLSAVPESEQCGWLKDKFGVSWQIVPEEMNKMMGSKDKEAIKRVTEAFLKMKKFNIAELKKAYEG